MGKRVSRPIAVLCLLVAGVAGAEEPILEFVEGLRERQYFDTALESLEAAQQRPDIECRNPRRD